MHYLAIRLPAEIILPQPEHPLPTIYSLVSSHLHKPAQVPNNNFAQPSSPTSSRHEQPHLPRPRPLHITKPLPILVHEDPATYALFIEGITLLAYNIAWACKSQGIPVGEEGRFDDICDIGRNLYNLLIGTKSRTQPPSRASSAQSTPSKNSKEGSEEEKKSNTEPLMGRYSHGTASHFLGGAEGAEFIRSWKLLSPLKVADKLKSILQNEVANKEWEVLDEGEWEVNDQMGDDGVVVGKLAEGDDLDTHSRLKGMEQSFMSCRTVADVPPVVEGDRGGDRRPGTSGWTKLKPRQ